MQETLTGDVALEATQELLLGSALGDNPSRICNSRRPEMVKQLLAAWRYVTIQFHLAYEDQA